MKRSLDPKTLKDWLGLKIQFNPLAVSWLGPLITVCIGLFVLFFVLPLVALLLMDLFQAASHSGPYVNDKDGSSIRNIGLVIVALIGAPFVIWRAIVAAKSVSLAEQSLLNDKINAAARDLTARRETTREVVISGEPQILKEVEDDIVIRLAALDRLEALSDEQPSFAPRIAKLLASYIRGTFPRIDTLPSDEITQRTIPRIDLQKSVDVIGRILEVAANEDPSNWRLDLRECNFDGVSFSDGYFRAVNFTGSRMETAFLNRGNFEGAMFVQCLLNYTKAFHANFRGANFSYVTLNKPEPRFGGMSESLNMGNIDGATFIGADISAIDYLGEPQAIVKTFGTSDTKVSSAIDDNMPDKKVHQRGFSLNYQLSRGKSITPDQSELVEKLKATGFENWPPYKSHDGAIGVHHEKFLQSLDMFKWPFKLW